jgi:hypothetical protein
MLKRSALIVAGLSLSVAAVLTVVYYVAAEEPFCRFGAVIC